VTTSSLPGPPTLADSPLVLLANLVAARRSGDRALERLARRRLDSLDVRVALGDELPAPITSEPKGCRANG
jgi:hypothetical protein